jgi:hypothetical protein
MAPTVPPQEVFSSSRRWQLRPAVVLTLAAALSCGGDETIPPDPPEPTRVTVSPGSLQFAALRDTARLSAQVHDQYDDLMADAAVTWASSDASVASVDSEGLVRSVGNGEAVVTATAGSAADSATVTVAQVVSAVGVSPAALEFSALGDTLRLAAEPVDANGHAVEGATVMWASGDTAVAVVDASGLVRSVGNGDTVMWASGDTAVAVRRHGGSCGGRIGAGALCGEWGGSVDASGLVRSVRVGHGRFGLRNCRGHGGSGGDRGDRVARGPGVLGPGRHAAFSG